MYAATSAVVLACQGRVDDPIGGAEDPISDWPDRSRTARDREQDAAAPAWPVDRGEADEGADGDAITQEPTPRTPDVGGALGAQPPRGAADAAAVEPDANSAEAGVDEDAALDAGVPSEAGPH